MTDEPKTSDRCTSCWNFRDHCVCAAALLETVDFDEASFVDAHHIVQDQCLGCASNYFIGVLMFGQERDEENEQAIIALLNLEEWQT